MRLSARWVLMGLALLVAAVMLTVPLPQIVATPRLSPVADLGHFFLYAALTAGLVWVARGRLVLALGLATAMNALCETAQLLSSRNANVGDFLRGLAGSLVVVLCIRALRGPRNAKRLAGYLVLVAVLSSWPIIEAVPYLADIYQESQQFPVLCDFQSPWQTTRWRHYDLGLERIPLSDSPSDFAGRFQFRPDRGWAVMYPLHHDWRAYHRLCFEATVEATVEGAPLELTIRLGPLPAGPHVGREFSLRFSPDVPQACIPLTPSAGGPGKGELDLSQVQSLVIWPNDLREPRALVVRKIWLE